MSEILSKEEVRLLSTPLKDLSKLECSMAFAARDKLADFNARQPSERYKKSSKVAFIDKDKLLANGVASPITGEKFSNRRNWNNHLKTHGCVEVGNDLNNAKPRSEIHGDFDCRKELTEAVHGILG